MRHFLPTATATQIPRTSIYDCNYYIKLKFQLSIVRLYFYSFPTSYNRILSGHGFAPFNFLFYDKLTTVYISFILLFFREDNTDDRL